VKVPESVKIVIRGKKHPNVTAKDFILKILSLDYVRSGKALAKVMEYAGEAVEALSVDERATMTNMGRRNRWLYRHRCAGRKSDRISNGPPRHEVLRCRKDD